MSMFSFAARPPRRAVLTPCIGVCSLGGDGLCEGCHRTADEIAAWSTLSDEARLHLMQDVLPRREAQRA